MLYLVENGKLVNVQGNPAQPYTHGRLCVKVKDYHAHHYNPDRVLQPLRRRGPKGSSKFDSITWDTALAEIGERWNAIISEYGAEAILPYGYAGNMGVLNGMNAGDAFFNKLGASIGEKTFCASSSVTAQLMTIGPSLGTDPESFVHAKYIVLWGTNTLSTNSHLWPYVLKARRRGARIVVIDPCRTRTAAQADWHIAVRPGTDAALALAMIHTIVTDGLVDQDYVDRYTVGFDELKASAANYPPEQAAAITGIAADSIRQLAREYAQTPPAVIRTGVGLERYPNGGQGLRAIDCLPAVTGAWRHVGGGLLQMPVFVPVRFDALSRPDWIRPETRIINLAQLGAVLTGGIDLNPPVKSLFIWNANPVSQAPDANEVERGLAREDLFTIVSEQFITDTAAYADLILPATMAGEHDDIVTSWGHFYIALNQRAVEPAGAAVSNTELFRRLAAAMRFTDPHFRKTDDELIADALDWDSPLLAGKSLDGLKAEGFVRLSVPDADHYAPHAEGNFPTASGKCEFRSLLGESSGFVAPILRQLRADAQAGDPIRPVPEFVAATDRGSYPLNLLTPKSHAFLNSGYANEAHKLRTQGEQFVLIHPDDAAARGIRDGDDVRIYNARGELRADARVTDATQAGTLVATFGYWRSRNRGGGAVNAVTEATTVGFAGTPFYNDARVEIEKS